MRLPMRLLAASVVAVLALAGCSSEPEGPDPLSLIDTETEPGADGIVMMTASNALRFSTALITAPAGEVNFQLTCGGAVEHNIVIEGQNGGDEVALCARGETGEPGGLTLDAGDYTFFCSIPGHKITMSGDLVIS